MAATFHSFLFNVDERGVATVTLNRPEKLNAISMEVRYELPALADELARNETIRAVVITAKGRAFCVGADVEYFERDWRSPSLRAFTRILTRFFDSLEELEKPVIAAINGTCVGGGLELALACDLRLAAEGARFGFPENNIGVIPGVGGCSRLVKMVGLGIAKELLMTGRIFDAAEARQVGLVNHVVPSDQLAGKTNEVLDLLLSKAPIALGLVKRVAWSASNVDASTARVFETFAQSILVTTRDHKEGLAAFRGKRPPKFSGR